MSLKQYQMGARTFWAISSPSRTWEVRWRQREKARCSKENLALCDKAFFVECSSPSRLALQNRVYHLIWTEYQNWKEGKEQSVLRYALVDRSARMWVECRQRKNFRLFVIGDRSAATVFNYHEAPLAVLWAPHLCATIYFSPSGAVCACNTELSLFWFSSGRCLPVLF